MLRVTLSSVIDKKINFTELFCVMFIDQSPEAHVFAFLSNNLVVKTLSEYAVAQLSALQECKQEE